MLQDDKLCDKNGFSFIILMNQSTFDWFSRVESESELDNFGQIRLVHDWVWVNPK